MAFVRLNTGLSKFWTAMTSLNGLFSNPGRMARLGRTGFHIRGQLPNFFQQMSTRQKLWILAASHGGRHHASPYVVSNRALDPIPSRMEQWRKALDFLNHYLKGMDSGVDKWPPIKYFNLAEEIFKETDVWPPKGTKNIRMFMREGNRIILLRKETRCPWCRVKWQN